MQALRDQLQLLQRRTYPMLAPDAAPMSSLPGAPDLRIMGRVSPPVLTPGGASGRPPQLQPRLQLRPLSVPAHKSRPMWGGGGGAAGGGFGGTAAAGSVERVRPSSSFAHSGVRHASSGNAPATPNVVGGALQPSPQLELLAQGQKQRVMSAAPLGRRSGANGIASGMPPRPASAAVARQRLASALAAGSQAAAAESGSAS
jgi:hypothetical protein